MKCSSPPHPDSSFRAGFHTGRLGVTSPCGADMFSQNSLGMHGLEIFFFSNICHFSGVLCTDVIHL